MTKIPLAPRESWAIKSARVFIQQAGINWLPVDPFKVAEQHGRILLTTRQASVLYKIPRHLAIGGDDSDTWYHNGQCKIIYNEWAYKPRITYTIAHEIGHIVLGHLKKIAKTRISRGTLTELTRLGLLMTWEEVVQTYGERPPDLKPPVKEVEF